MFQLSGFKNFLQFHFYYLLPKVVVRHENLKIDWTVLNHWALLTQQNQDHKIHNQSGWLHAPCFTIQLYLSTYFMFEAQEVEPPFVFGMFESFISVDFLLSVSAHHAKRNQQLCKLKAIWKFVQHLYQVVQSCLGSETRYEKSQCSWLCLL